MRSSSKGFTLLEMLVVLVILAVTGALVFTSVGRSARNRSAQTFAREITSFCRQARWMAMAGGAPVGIMISSDERVCWVEGASKSTEIPKDMLVEGEGIAEADDGVYTIRFYADGSSSGGQLFLSVLGRVVYAFRVDLLTGLVARIEI